MRHSTYFTLSFVFNLAALRLLTLLDFIFPLVPSIDVEANTLGVLRCATIHLKTYQRVKKQAQFSLSHFLL